MPDSVVQFLSLEEAIVIHERLIDRFAGKPGLRDADSGHAFIVGALENGTCDYDHLRPWIQQHLQKL